MWKPGGTLVDLIRNPGGPQMDSRWIPGEMAKWNLGEIQVNPRWNPRA